ncbi:hypothetical protein D3C73_1455810 [compost metagenome]
MQGLFATFAGLIRAYVAMEYSIKWAILLHVINNFVFSDGLGFLIQDFPDRTQGIITYTLYALFFVGGMIAFRKSKATVKSYLRENQVEKGRYRATFTALWIVLYVAANLMLAIDGVEKLP